MTVVTEALKRYKLALDAEGDNRQAAIEDLEFAAGKQWPAAIEMARTLENRPCLTINKTDTFVRNVVNNMRQQRPRIKVHPVADGADVKIADVIQGLIRHIEVNSNADLAYDTGADYQVRMGWGYWRVLSKYVDDKSFDQELYIERIRNPFSVYFDPSSTAPDGSDAKWVIITERMKREDFKREYPGADPCDFPTMGAGDGKVLWATKTEVVVAEYIRYEDTPETLCMLSNGMKVFKSELPSDEVMQLGGLTVVQERDSMRRVVKWSKVTANEEIDSRDLKGKYIPVVRITGAELLTDGKVIRYGMVRQLKDPARMYNFWRTAETEVVALAPKAPWIMVEGQDEGHEEEWNTANTKSYSSLKWRAVTTDDGTVLPGPQRQQPQQIPAAHVNAAMSASEDLKAVAGMFDPALGAQGNETSGVMVNARQAQSDLSNFHFYDNETVSIRHTGKILLNLIPYIYDTERTLRIIGEDGEAQSVTINDKTKAVGKVLNDLTVGLYDVVMDTGPGYQTKRQEAAAGMMELLKTELGKQVGQVAGDVIIRTLDIPGIDKIADRLAASNPLAQLDKQLPEDLPQEAKQFIAQLMSQLQQQKQLLQQLQQEKAAKVFGENTKAQGKLASDHLWSMHEMEQEKFRQENENKRLLASEHAQNERTAMQEQGDHERVYAKILEDWREAVLDAKTDLALGKDRGAPNDND